VVVLFIVTTEGNVTDPVVISSSDPTLNAPVLDTLGRWIFVPAQVKGEHAAVTGGQEFRFP
jgi:TonB family protein